MKKLLGIVVLGLLWCNVGFAKCIVGNCSNGQGTYAYHNGDIYVGEHKDNKRHGLGTYAYHNGDKYVGEHKDNKQYGQGTYVYADGDKYVGEHKDGKKHGQGTFTRVDGKVEKGNWEYNELQSTFTKIWENGEMILVQILRFGFLF